MTDKTQPDAGSTHIIRYALEMGLLWIDGDGRDKVREALAALDALEAQLSAIGAGGVSGPMMGQPQAMPDLSALTERGAKAWAGVDAQGLRDGVASAGSAPVAWVDERALSWLANSRSLSATITTKLEKGKSFERPTPLYLHPSPPEGMVGGWTKASQQLPPCRDDQLYIGINTAGFAGVFNDVADVAGNVLCFYETAEEYIKVMSNLDIWQPFTPPTSSADSRKGE